MCVCFGEQRFVCLFCPVICSAVGGMRGVSLNPLVYDSCPFFSLRSLQSVLYQNPILNTIQNPCTAILAWTVLQTLPQLLTSHLCQWYPLTAFLSSRPLQSNTSADDSAFLFPVPFYILSCLSAWRIAMLRKAEKSSLSLPERGGRPISHTISLSSRKRKPHLVHVFLISHTIFFETWKCGS